MMTQKLQEQQQFNALEFELKHSRDFQVLQNTYINYEVDSIEDDFGELCRVWNGHTLVGTFYKNADSKWVASPHYQNRQLIELDKDLSQTFDSSFEAVAYTQATYEGVEYAFACDYFLPPQLHYVKFTIFSWRYGTSYRSQRSSQ